MSDKHGTVAWTELMTRDVAQARSFYGEVCGWTFEEMPMGGGSSYLLGKVGDHMVVGLLDMTAEDGMDGMPTQWLTYFEVDDVDAAVDRARKGGASVYREPWDVPGVGRIAVVADPGGAALGIMTSAEAPQAA